MLRKLNLIPLLVVPVMTTSFVLREGIIKTPWSDPPKTAATLPPAENFRITSAYTKATYAIRVQRPHDYSADGKPYPVMYLLQNVSSDRGFDDVVAPLLNRRHIPDVIYVNVSIAHNRRRDLAALMVGDEDRIPIHTWVDDLTFHADPEDPTEGGGAEAFTAFLEYELIPKIDSAYHSDRTDRGIGGAGIGGLYAVAISYRRPGLFKRAIAIAPRVGFANFALIEDLRAMERRGQARPDTRLYIGVGSEDYPASVQGFVILRDTLDNYPSDSVQVKTELLRGRNNENQYVSAAQAGLRFVYATSD